MYRSVADWIESPPVSAAVIEQAGRLWEGGADSTRITKMLKLTHKAELYQLRPHLGWTKRSDYAAGQPMLQVTWTESELARGREQWVANEPAKIIAATLHLAERRQVYQVAQRFGWPRRRKAGRARAELLAAVQIVSRLPRDQVHREVRSLGMSRTGRPRTVAPKPAPPPKPEPAPVPEPAPEAKHRRKVAVMSFGDLPTDHLVRICPVCDGRVTPEHGIRVQGTEGEELVHASCLDPARMRVAA